MKYISNKTAILIIFAAILTLMPALTYGYNLLAPLPGLASCDTFTDATACTADSSCSWDDAANACTTTGSLLSAYLSALFRFAIVVASVLAVIVIIIAGLKYLGAAGNPAVINDAKDQIYWAVLGLILALSSWMILNIINPKLVKLELRVESTTKITSPGFEGLFSGTYCSKFTEPSACNKDNDCIWGGNNSCEQKPCPSYSDQTTCDNNAICKWADNKCQIGKVVTSACYSLDKIACGNNAYCTWQPYRGTLCVPKKSVWCNFASKTLPCNTGICGLDSGTGALCCVGITTKDCAPNSSVIGTPF